MRGDFSAWNKDGSRNFRGTLHQQGRVFLDRDWNAQTEVFTEWQNTAGRDAFGAGVAAVPAEAPESFRVTEARIEAGQVRISASKGRVWADGLLVESAQDIVKRGAAYLNMPPGTLPDPMAAPKDAVVLETWLEELSPFQIPALLIEPALGGVDTTERVQTAYRFRLYRMGLGETCDSILPQLKDDFSAKGKLTVKLNPTTNTGGDCPVVETGGYTGFEHRLYRIEIAETGRVDSWFKWSQFNGGLVGTGDFDILSRTVAIHGNLNAIVHSGLSEFYLEALDLDDQSGYWRVIYGAKATLGADNTLALPAAGDAAEFLGALPPAPAKGKRFFRLWNGIEAVAGFAAAEKDLPDLVGIKMKFDTGSPDKYTPSDYWTFEVRASGIGNPLVLIGDPATSAGVPPQGVFYHRVPLAEIMWRGNPVTGGAIEDCRRVFQPLTKLKTCCTYRVGDGVHTHGDFSSIQAAVNALPKDGGEICVLPGLYSESVLIDARRNIVIHGCGPRTRVGAVADANQSALPGILINASSGIVIDNLAIEAGPRSAVQIGGSRRIAVRRCLIRMRDVFSIWQAVFSRGDEVLIEGNTIEILPPSDPLSGPLTDLPKDIEAPAANMPGTAPDPVAIANAARGGIQIGGGSDRVRILDNLIQGGVWNGITLGSLEAIADGSGETPDVTVPGDHCDKCEPPDLTESGDPDDGSVRYVSAGDLYEIEIRGNRITDMGINGIGIVRYFDLAKGGDMIGVHGLHISDNLITRCLRLGLAPVGKAMERLVAYGGIALARVVDLRILRNQILANGAGRQAPVCGVFAIIVQGAQIDDNRILDNGGRSDAKEDVSSAGVRGGVHIWLVLPAAAQSTGLKSESVFSVAKSLGNGAASCVLRDNLIVAPIGRAVTFFALGQVVVARNRLATQATTGKGLDLVAATVFIGNLGISNEWTLGLLLASILRLTMKSQDSLNFCVVSKLLGLVKSVDPLQLWPPLSRYWATGKILFTENQVTLDVSEQPLGIVLSSLLVFSLDDVGFTDNQCEVTSTNLFVAANAVVLGLSARIADNRFSETWMRALTSALTLGGMNTTTDNQATHCIKAMALLPGMLIFRDNLSLVNAFCPDECKQG